MEKKEKNLQETKQEIKRLLEEKNEKDLIKLLNFCVNDEKLTKEFTSMKYEMCLKLPKEDSDEEFYELGKIRGKTHRYLASNYGRMAIEDIEGKNRKIIPQWQDNNDWNWYLNVEKFKEDNSEFRDKTLTKTKKVYNFMKETKWLEEEYKEIENWYPDCKLQLHHICKNGNNRIDNLVYLPKCIHNKVNHNYKA